jgi:AraC-like DNA-binding protein
MRSAVKEFREQLDEMSRSLRSYSDDARNKLLHSLLTGLLPSDEAAAQLAALNITPPDGPFSVVLVRYQDEPGTDAAYTHGLGARELLAAALTDEPAFYHLVGLSYSACGIIFCEGDTAGLAERMRRILISVEPEFGLEIYAFVGQPCEGIAGIYESYRTATRMSGQSEFGLYKSKVAAYGEPSGEQNTGAFHYPLELEQTLIDGIVTGKNNVWRSAVAELIEANRPSGDLKTLSLMLTATVNRIIDSVNRTALDFFDEETVVYLEFRSCRSMDELNAKTLSLLSHIAGRVEQFRQATTQGMYERMTAFLHENYAKDISLYDLADHLNMSRNYVSTLFKASTGQNFKDYLSQYRYKTACGIMTRHPDMMIRDVAERVGCNTDSFARLFARYGGVTPKEYQRGLKDN